MGVEGKSLLGSNTMLFAGTGCENFAQKMADYLNMKVSKSTCIRFSDGNTFVRADETVRDKDVVLVKSVGVTSNDDFVEILFWLDAFKRASAHTVSVIIPYFSYAKADKKDEPRVSIRARVCAECMELAGADSFMILDLHSAQVQGFFKKPADNLLPIPLLCEAVKKFGWNDNLTVVSPDAGGAKRARKYASYLGAATAIGDKLRDGHDENAKIMDIIGDVKGKNCLIADDFSTSGNTIVNVAKALKAEGAGKVYACLSHNIITQEGARLVDESPLEYVISTDSITSANIGTSPKFVKISVAPLFAESLMHDFKHQSVSELFSKVPKRLMDASFGNVELP